MVGKVVLDIQHSVIEGKQILDAILIYTKANGLRIKTTCLGLF